MMATFYRKIMFLDDAMIVRPVTAEDIKWANNELENSNLPLIPTGYADFLKHCNGVAFNGVELYGTDIVTDPQTNFKLIDIVSFSEQQLELFNDQLLYFGRVDDDIFTFNPAVEKYETRDITSFEIWNEYNSFEEFLEKEISEKYLPTEENEVISSMVYSRMKEDPVFAKNILEYYTLMADSGNAEAQYQLAMLLMYEGGVVEQDYDTGFDWLARAAEQGYPQAGLLYLEETSTDDDGRYDAWV